MMKISIAFLVGSVLVVFLLADFADAERPLSIESRAAWMTPLQPEVHLLLTSADQSAKSFSVFFGSDGNIVCKEKLETGDISVDLRLRRFDTLFAARSSGIVPAGGWAHRSFILGSDGSVGPCVVPYVVEFGNGQQARIEGVIQVPKSPQVNVSGFSVPAEWGEAEVMIESRSLPNRYILRVLVRNHSASLLSVSVTDRQLTCESGGRAVWDLMDGVPTESGIGPAWVGSDRWVVFAAPIRVEGADCTGSVEISAARSHGASYSEPIIVRFLVVATGRFDD